MADEQRRAEEEDEKWQSPEIWRIKKILLDWNARLFLHKGIQK